MKKRSRGNRAYGLSLLFFIAALAQIPVSEIRVVETAATFAASLTAFLYALAQDSHKFDRKRSADWLFSAFQALLGLTIVLFGIATLLRVL